MELEKKKQRREDKRHMYMFEEETEAKKDGKQLTKLQQLITREEELQKTKM